MSAITSKNPNDQLNRTYAGDVIVRQLREGNASVVETLKSGSLATWCIVPADSDSQVGLSLRAMNRNEVELGARAAATLS